MSVESQDKSFGRGHLHQFGTISLDDSLSLGDGSDSMGLSSAYPFPTTGPAMDATSPPSMDSSAAVGNASAAAFDTGVLSAAAQAAAGVPSGLVIVANYDTSISDLQTSSPTLYTQVTGAITKAIQFYENHIANSITLSINFGYGEIGGKSLPGSALGESSANDAFGLASYSAVRSLLSNHATSTDDATAVSSLLASDPTNKGGFFLTNSQWKALGSPTVGVDGSIGLSSTHTFTYDPANRGVAGEFDAIGVLEHEISEVMGRLDSLGTAFGTNEYTPLDLFRYSAPGTRDLTPGAGYFSINSGTTDIAQFNNPGNGADAGDWDSSVTNDAFDAFATMGVPNAVSTTDLRLMDVLGFTLSNSSACYMAGTRILTSRGEVRVEDLSIGDIVHVRFAGLTPIKWIGHRRIDCRRHPDPHQVSPVHIVLGALGPDQPSRDLWLSPDHAVAIDGVLIPIKLLVNGASIRQETGWSHADYFHVELEQHDLLLAEGLLAESYLDTGNRGLFANADAPLLLHPRRMDAGGQVLRETLSCLPFCCEPAVVEPIWDALAARAESLGPAHTVAVTTDDPELAIVAGRQRFKSVLRDGSRYTFVLPALPTGGRLRSRSNVPSALRPWLQDRRHLGVMVRCISLRRGSEQIDLALDDPRLRHGWWVVERDAAAVWRWTDGDAELPPIDGPSIVEVMLGGTPRYPVVAPTDAKQPAISRSRRQVA